MQDYEGQRLSEQIMQWVIIVAAVSVHLTLMAVVILCGHSHCLARCSCMSFQAVSDVLAERMHAKDDSFFSACWVLK